MAKTGYQVTEDFKRATQLYVGEQVPEIGSTKYSNIRTLLLLFHMSRTHRQTWYLGCVDIWTNGLAFGRDMQVRKDIIDAVKLFSLLDHLDRDRVESFLLFALGILPD